MSHACHPSEAEDASCGWSVEKLRAGDQTAWRAAYSDLWRIAYAAVRTRVFSVDVAEDLAQETLATVSAELNNLADNRHIKAMTAIIARRKAAHHLRDETAAKRDRRKEVGLDCAKEIAEPATLARGLMDLEQALAGLDPLDRALLHGHFVRGMKSHELAAEHGLNASTVRGRLKRALDNLKTTFGSAPGGGLPVMLMLLGLPWLYAAANAVTKEGSS